MSENRDARDGAPSSSPVPAGSPITAIDEAGLKLRAPWAASVAGLLFAVLFTATLVMMRSSPLVSADDAELIELFRAGHALVVSFWDWIVLVLPAWVAIVSLFILRRERQRSRSGTAAPRMRKTIRRATSATIR